MKVDGEKEKKMWKIKKILLFHHFTLKISDRGDLFSIPWTTYSRKFLPNSVNHDQDWIPIKITPNFLNKLLPSGHRRRFWTCKESAHAKWLWNIWLEIIPLQTKLFTFFSEFAMRKLPAEARSSLLAHDCITRTKPLDASYQEITQIYIR